MVNIVHHKTVSQLPAILEPNAVYYVRVGNGFDHYVVNSDGSAAVKQNSGLDGVLLLIPSTSPVPEGWVAVGSAGTAMTIVMQQTTNPVQPYLGVVATGGHMADKAYTGSKQLNSRSTHLARDTIERLRVKLPGWWWQRNTHSTGERFREHNVGANITYRCAIEYPEGTFTAVNFSGGRDGTCLPGENILSDYVEIAIPRNARFWVRTFYQCSWGMIYIDGDNGFNQPIDLANGEALEHGASGLTDKTMNGTIVADTANAYGPIFKPLAIVAETTRPSILFLGDSRVWGYRDVRNAEGFRGELERAFGPDYGFINIGAGGDTLHNFVTYAPKRAALQEHVSHVIVQSAINGLASTGNNRTAADVLDALQNVLAMFPTKKRFTATTVPGTVTSTDSYATLANQTPNANNAAIQAYNSAIRAGVANSDGYIELADGLEHERSGVWQVPDLTDDGLHANPNGYAHQATFVRQSEVSKIFLDGEVPDYSITGTGGGSGYQWRSYWDAAATYNYGDLVSTQDALGIMTVIWTQQTPGNYDPQGADSEMYWDILSYANHGTNADVRSFATDAEAQSYSTANPNAVVFSREGIA